jgi:hypothetical protein
MPQATIIAVFLFVWVCALAYVLSVLRLAHAMRQLKAEGRGKEAPNIIFNLPDAIPGLVWVVTGRYASLGDPRVTRRAQLARLPLFIVLPMVLAVVAIAATTVLS